MISQLLKNFQLNRPKPLVSVPKWDLTLVLRVLSRQPYEPLSDIDFKRLAMKTVFLLLLASARRRGDIYAIDPRRITYTDRAAILFPFPGYLPKVTSTAEGQERFKPIVIRQLSNVTPDPAELVLCPVRALKMYDKIASRRAPGRTRFFISTAAAARPVCKNTISAWTVRLIREAYEAATADDLRLYRAHTHEIRAISASLALQANFALDDVLAAATWKNASTFTDYYLRDVEGIQQGLHTLTPCVVAGVRMH